MQFNRRLKKILEFKKIRMADLARTMKVERQFIYNYIFEDRSPREETVIKFATALDVPIEFLRGQDQNCIITQLEYLFKKKNYFTFREYQFNLTNHRQHMDLLLLNHAEDILIAVDICRVISEHEINKKIILEKELFTLAKKHLTKTFSAKNYISLSIIHHDDKILFIKYWGNPSSLIKVPSIEDLKYSLYMYDFLKEDVSESVGK